MHVFLSPRSSIFISSISVHKSASVAERSPCTINHPTTEHNERRKFTPFLLYVPTTSSNIQHQLLMVFVPYISYPIQPNTAGPISHKSYGIFYRMFSYLLNCFHFRKFKLLNSLILVFKFIFYRSLV